MFRKIVNRFSWAVFIHIFHSCTLKCEGVKRQSLGCKALLQVVAPPVCHGPVGPAAVGVKTQEEYKIYSRWRLWIIQKNCYVIGFDPSPYAPMVTSVATIDTR